MELQSSKRMVKCLYRIIQGVQLCSPQSDIERLDILHERVLKRSLTQETGFNPSALGNRRNTNVDKSLLVNGLVL